MLHYSYSRLSSLRGSPMRLLCHYWINYLTSDNAAFLQYQRRRLNTFNFVVLEIYATYKAGSTLRHKQNTLIARNVKPNFGSSENIAEIS